MKKCRYESPFVTVTYFAVESAILQYSGLKDMETPPDTGWKEDLDDDFIV
ncbi:MAG: hypothetical protein J6X99_02275 [Bacteroidales bacterium]|nr:hypothetical protein [Bacteroidales bacterium]